MKILLAVDGSRCSEEAAREFARRPWPEGTELRIVAAFEYAPMVAMPEIGGPPGDFYERLSRAAEHQASAAVDRAVALVRAVKGAAFPITTGVMEGSPKTVILQEAEQIGADLIMVGSHGYTGLARLWLGSVSHAVATHAKCSVEIVRSRETAGD